MFLHNGTNAWNVKEKCHGYHSLKCEIRRTYYSIEIYIQYTYISWSTFCPFHYQPHHTSKYDMSNWYFPTSTPTEEELHLIVLIQYLQFAKKKKKDFVTVKV